MRRHRDVMGGCVNQAAASRGWGTQRRNWPAQDSRPRAFFSMKTRTSVTNRKARRNTVQAPANGAGKGAGKGAATARVARPGAAAKTAARGAGKPPAARRTEGPRAAGRTGPARTEAGTSARGAGVRRQDGPPRRGRPPVGAPRGGEPVVAAAPPAPPPRVESVSVADDRAGQRLDNFLLARLKGVPRSLIYRICRSGEVRINGARAKPDQRLAEGDVVRIPPVRVASPGEHAPPASSQLERIQAAILHEDRDFLVIDKPAGIASHGGSGVSFGAIELLRAARPRDTLELAHRLDRDTSGVLVLTRRRSALLALQAAIRDGRVDKRYLALIAGALPHSPLDVDAPLRKSILQGGERMVQVDADGKPSRSRFVQLQRHGEASLVEVALDTGRTHQIRVHARHIGHPLAGDDKYGEREFNKRMREHGLRRLFLHAARFAFELGDRSHVFSAPLAAELVQVLDALEAHRE